ncbi:ADP-ribosylation Crystallin J1 [Chlorella sorokiniana]|uniref:ADP-ribosylation Crystallin J1 n=1 Tax=Chlorella sorokiniana TaxID=3076 RepID=A0A2P6TFD3_CHLSO|nr:ADP-ribosylation Crystallin J1 [Chlorella sorokiniana]|eukprot:PRW32678.1 ADP-ribosylation Crystallin J1 [Chlorella sorokiniana]
MPGGGCFDVGPGQFTDDTELALCLAYGLAGNPPSGGFPAQAVGREYVWWANSSEPFDIGVTTATAFSLPYGQQVADHAAAIQGNVQNAQSLASKANGALMRATPVAIWAHRLPAQAIAAAAAADARLSHPNQATQDANAAYVIAVASLIRQPGDAAAALAAAESWAAEHACLEVQQWLAGARDVSVMQQYQATAMIGFAKHAFQLAFYHLRQRSSFLEGLQHALLAGGDTDTNAAIVCGMLGALHGAAAIPADLRSKVESYEWTAGMPHGGSCVRPDQLRGKHLVPLAGQLYGDAMRDAAAGQ